MTKATHIAAYLVRKLWLTLAILLVLFAVMLSGLRYALPYIDHKKYLLEDYVNEQYGVNLSIGSVHATWQPSGPSVVLNQVALAQNESSPVELSIDKVYVEVDFWQSLRSAMVSSNQFMLTGLGLVIDADQMQQGPGNDVPVVKALKSLFLEQLQQFSLTDGEVTLVRDGATQVFDIESLGWLNHQNRHQGSGQFRVQELTTNSASFIIDLHGKGDELSGVAYAQATDLDISPWVSGWLHTKRTLQESRANLQTWAEIEKGSVSAIWANLDDTALVWGGDESTPLHTGLKGGSLQALPHSGGWNFRIDQLIFSSNDQSIVTDLVGQMNKNGELLVNTVKPVPVNPFLVLLPLFTDDTADDVFADLKPTGQLATLQFQSRERGIELAAKLIDVSWEQQGNLPGIKGVDADIFWYKNQGVIAFEANNAQLAISNLLSEDILIDQLKGDVYLYTRPDSEGNNWIVQTNDLRFTSETVSFTQSFRFNTSTRHLSLYTHIEEMPVAGVSNLFPPSLMGEATSDYLTRALPGPGTIEQARILWFGSLAEFPFASNEGIFQANVDLSGTEFVFAGNWPALTALDLNLHFENAALRMFSPSARLMNVAVADMTAVIPELTSSALLSISATGSGTGEDLASLMTSSSLSGSLGSLFTDEIKIDGNITADLQLEIPLNSDAVVARGEAALTGNGVTLERLGLQFDEVSGVVAFENASISATEMTATLLEQPVIFNLAGSSSPGGYGVDVNMSGEWDVVPLVREFNEGYLDYMAGVTEWEADVQVLLPEQGFTYTAKLQSPLTGIVSDLPAPFNKKVDAKKTFAITAQGDEQASTISASIGRKVRFDGVLPHKEKQFSRAHLALGDSDFMGLGMGFSISADLDVVDVSHWYKTLAFMTGEESNTGSGLFSIPQRIFLHTEDLVFEQQRLSDVSITAKQANNNWLLDITSAQARASVNLYDEWLTRGIEINADYLRFDKWQEQNSASEIVWDASSLPPIYLHCGHCILFDKNLGEVTLDVAKVEDGMEIRQLRAESKHGTFNATGRWNTGAGVDQSFLSGTLASHDVGLMLKEYGVDAGIKDSEATVAFNLRWPRSPMDFSLASVAGELHWELSDGYLSELSDKGSRIFTLFSLNSLVRKLSLDFRDVFAKGFFYEEMSGSIQLADGKAVTQDTEIDGGAGEIEIKGFTDLQAQSLNYHVNFTPNVTGSLPFLVYFLATPPTALAALALDQVLTSAKVISNVNYKVTGTLNDPIFEEVGRDSKDITLPARAPAVPRDPQIEALTEPDLERLQLEVIDG